MIELPANIFISVDEGLIVRSSGLADLSAILGLLAQMHEDEAAIEPCERARATFVELLNSPSRVVLVAVKDDVVVGTIDVFVMPNLTRGCRPWAGIENLVVDESQRGQGYGRALLEAAIAVAQDAGCYKAQLVSHDRRDAAHSLYEKLGFLAPVRGYRRYFDT
jgi:GNAT superfamily N-acetyltransferase